MLQQLAVLLLNHLLAAALAAKREILDPQVAVLEEVVRVVTVVAAMVVVEVDIKEEMLMVI